MKNKTDFYTPHTKQVSKIMKKLGYKNLDVTHYKVRDFIWDNIEMFKEKLDTRDLITICTYQRMLEWDCNSPYSNTFEFVENIK